MSLADKKCVPCEGGTAPLSKEQVEKLLSEVSGWEEDGEYKKIRKHFKFDDFRQAVTFVNRVAEVAETEEHHPDIHINYNKVELVLWTHAIGGLSENDFIMAAKIDDLR